MNFYVGDLNCGLVRDSRFICGFGVVGEFYYLCGVIVCYFINFISGIFGNCGKWEIGL